MKNKSWNHRLLTQRLIKKIKMYSYLRLIIIIKEKDKLHDL